MEFQLLQQRGMLQNVYTAVSYNKDICNQTNFELYTLCFVINQRTVSFSYVIIWGDLDNFPNDEEICPGLYSTLC